MILILKERLLCESERRLGRNSAAEIKEHPFFRGIDWENIRSQKAPFVPQLSSMTDTKYFPTDELEDVPADPLANLQGNLNSLSFDRKIK